MSTGPRVVFYANGEVALVSLWVFNCYVVFDAGAQHPLVIDPGLPSLGDTAYELLAKRGVTQTPVVVCTHSHADHLGGVSTFINRYQELNLQRPKVYLPIRAKSYLGGEVVKTPGLRELIKILPVLTESRFSTSAIAELAKTSRVAGVTKSGMTLDAPVDGWLNEGDTLPEAPDYTVKHSPGHTDDSTSFYSQRFGRLFSGDSILTHAGQAIFNPEITSITNSQTTEQRFRSLEVAELLPGHGRPVMGRNLLNTARSFSSKPPSAAMSARLARALGHWH